jgi:hypothetical protein
VSAAKTSARATEVVAAFVEAAVPDEVKHDPKKWFDGDAHATLMALYKDLEMPPQLRMQAAAKAINYEKPALASITLQGEGHDNSIEHARRLELLESLQQLKDKVRGLGENAKVIEGEVIR